jgi:cholesterol transport system auxiliary component
MQVFFRWGIIWVWLALVVTGCTSFGKPELPPTIYDITVTHDGVRRIGFPMSSLEVIAPTWLASSAMQYRFEPGGPLERRFFATSRWAGMPAEMVEVVLGRVIQTEPAANGSGCRLRVDLDEFIQRFETATRSTGRIEVRASLLAPRTDVIVAYRAFVAESPAPTADASGGVVALRDGVNTLAVELADWLVGLEQAGNNTVAQRCAR